MDISSNHRAALTLPNGQAIPSRGSVTVKTAEWAGMKDHPVVAGWFSEGKLTKGPEPEVKPDAPVPPALDGLSDDELRVLLKDKGINADGRWGRDKLLTEARKVQS